MDVSPAFNIRMLASQIGTKITPNLVAKVTIDGKAFNDVEKPANSFQLGVEPQSGIIITRDR